MVFDWTSSNKGVNTAHLCSCRRFMSYWILAVEAAKLAGVSNTMVSRVINYIGTVKPETIEHVGKTMARTGYTLKPFSSRSGPRLSSYFNGNDRHNKPTDLIALVMCINRPSRSFLSFCLLQAHCYWFSIALSLIQLKREC